MGKETRMVSFHIPQRINEIIYLIREVFCDSRFTAILTALSPQL